jgi:hypothetical protein
MRAGYVDGVDRSRWSDIRIQEGWAHHGSNYMIVAVARYGRSVAVCNSKGWHSLFFSTQHRFYRIPEALPEADGDEYIFRGQDFDFVLQRPRASTWCLRIESKRRQSVSQIKSQRSGEV